MSGEITATQAAHNRSGAGAVVAAVTMHLDGAGHRSLGPLRHLEAEEQIVAANSAFIVLLSAVLTELGSTIGREPGQLLERFALGVARIEGDAR